MNKATRILVANHPKLMRDVILATLDGQSGIEIVGEVSEEAEILGQVKQTRPDLLVIALDDSGRRPPLCEQLLREHPELRILAVASRKDLTLYYWASFQIHCADVETSPLGILNAVQHPAGTASRPS